MLCDNCKDKDECTYYLANIKPVQQTEQRYELGNDSYLMALKIDLNNFKCNYFNV